MGVLKNETEEQRRRRLAWQQHYQLAKARERGRKPKLKRPPVEIPGLKEADFKDEILAYLNQHRGELVSTGQIITELTRPITDMLVNKKFRGKLFFEIDKLVKMKKVIPYYRPGPHLSAKSGKLNYNGKKYLRISEAVPPAASPAVLPSENGNHHRQTYSQ